jgi:hypothetical protein
MNHMSSISLSLKMLLAASACAGLTLIACGDDSGSSDKDSTDDDDKTGSKKDASVSKDAGKDAGKKDSSVIPQGVPGEDCSDAPVPVAQCAGCGSAICTTMCGDDGTWGECTSLSTDSGVPGLGNLLGDGGGIKVSDAGVSVTIPGSDASVNIPATECPADLTCNDVASGFAAFGVPPVKFCTASDSVTPPACSTQKDCTDMGFKVSTCMPIPGLSAFLPGNFCLSSCK